MSKNCKWLFEDSPALLLLLDELLICRNMTSVWRKQLALPEPGDGGIPVAELFDFEENPALLDQLDAVINQGSSMVDVPVSLLVANGALRVRVSAWRIQHDDNDQPFVLVAATDVSEFERAYEELSQLQIQHQLILDAAGEGVYGLDCNGKITFSNAAATGILGWKLEDIHGQSAHEVHHHSHVDGSNYPRIECPIYAALHNDRVRLYRPSSKSQKQMFARH